MRTSRHLIISSLALLGVAGVAAAGEVGVGMAAPPLKAHKWVKGKPVNLKDGKLHVIEMWATW
jgi:hypothetical protein